MINTGVIFIGKPGAGKGTQSQILTDAFPQIKHLSTGDAMRQMQSANTELGNYVAELITRGNFVPDEITIKIVKEHLMNLKDDIDILILDGYPRNLAQAEDIFNNHKTEYGIENLKLLFLDIDTDIVRVRLPKRRMCNHCKRIILPVEFRPSERGKTLVHHRCEDFSYRREDDKPEYIEYRLEKYENDTAPVVDYFLKNDGIIRVDAGMPIRMVTSQIIGMLNIG